MCCGSRRAAWRSASASPVRQAAGPPTSTPQAAPAGPWAAGGFPTVDVRYGESGEVELRGPVTGRAYRFSGVEPLQSVDARDAAILLRGAAFEPA